VTSAKRPRLSLQRESRILLLVALLLLVLLSSFTLGSYRHAVDALAGEQRDRTRQEAERLAEQMAGQMAGRWAGDIAAHPDSLLRHLPPGSRLAIVGQDGAPLLEIGTFESRDLLPPSLGPAEVDPAELDLADARLAAGLDGWLEDYTAGFAPIFFRRQRAILRLDVPAPTLASQIRASRVLTAVVVGVNLAVALLVVLFIRNLLRPYEAMLARARELEPDAAGDDEAAYLVSVFERALDALGGGAGVAEATGPGPAEPGSDDIEALQRALGGSLGGGLLLLNGEGRVLALNPYGASLLGAPQPAAGKSLAEVVGAHDDLRTVLEAAVAGARTVQRYESDLTVAGERRTLGLTVHPLRRDDGTLRAFLVLFVDLTEARRLADEQRLSKTLAQIGELAAGLAHELRNSLATMKGYLALLDRPGTDDSHGEYLAELQHEADHLQRVLEDFLSFARPGTTRMERVSVEVVARRAAADPALGGAKIAFESRGDEPPTLQGDAQLLERAVRNLLHNAVGAQQRSGRSEAIELTLASTAEALDLAIADRGDGISDEIKERLFQPFATSRADGVGLGLALSRRIVDLHGGRLTLEPREGGGAVAAMTFPRGKAASAGPAALP
jgi:signal transduction histidine kinase